LKQVSFQAADLSGANLDGAVGANAIFIGAKLHATSAANTHFSSALFADCDMESTDLRGAKLDQCMFRGARALDSRFENADLTYADFSHADISGSDFSGATLFRAKFHQTTEKRTIFTNRTAAYGTDPDVAEAERWLTS